MNEFLVNQVFDGSILAASLVAIVAGLISFASPCVLPLLPGYLGYVSGAFASKKRMVLGSFLFVLGFVLDFLEIIYIVIPIVGPVIYGGTMDPKWVTIMIAVNLQTSFLTPPFGFALFYLRGVAPKEVTTGHIYRGVIPFVLIQVLGLLLLFWFPWVVTIIPNLLAG